MSVAPVKSRVEMMREAVAEARQCRGYNDLKTSGISHAALAEVLSVIAKPYVDLDPRFFADIDETDGLPDALIVANGQGGQYVPLKWSARAVNFDRTEFGLETITVPLGADDRWDRLIDAMEKTVTDFYDRHQPRGAS